jgi:predicted RNase H-like HicB family nuclease
MQLTTEFEQESDGRWVAEIPELPGVLAYGASRDDAYRAVRALALRVIADRLEHGESVPPQVLQVFAAA